MNQYFLEKADISTPKLYRRVGNARYTAEIAAEDQAVPAVKKTKRK